MANMGHCRFQNTVQDLEDCREHLDDDLGGEEHRARQRLVDLCNDIVAAYNAGEVPENARA